MNPRPVTSKWIPEYHEIIWGSWYFVKSYHSSLGGSAAAGPVGSQVSGTETASFSFCLTLHYVVNLVQQNLSRRKKKS